jgi:L-asparaginase
MTLVLAATGGTIASLPDSETGGVAPAITAHELVARVPALADVDTLEVIDIAQVNGWNMTPQTMLTLAHTLYEQLARSDVAGAVVTHGTDTVEETAFLCDLVLDTDKPIVFASAMRSAGEVAADGPRTLLAAARVAASADARGWGALLVANDEIHAARACVKTDSFRPSSLRSPGRGPVGAVTPERLRLAGPPPSRFALVAPPSELPEVALIETYTGMPERLIEAVVAHTGARGLVLDGTGAGNVPGVAMAGIAAISENGLPVVVATRVATGGTVPIYGGPGGGLTLRKHGVVGAGALTAAKARLLLMSALGVEPCRERALALFTRAVNTVAPGAFGPD